jgi:hypothetical protein
MTLNEGKSLLSLIERLLGRDIVLVGSGQVLAQDLLHKALSGASDLQGPLLALKDGYSRDPEGAVREVRGLRLSMDEYNALAMLVENYSDWSEDEGV